MQRTNLLKSVESIKLGIPDDVAPSTLAVIQDVQDVVICLSSHVNNMYDRDAYDDLQVDFQIFLYLFQRILLEETKHGGTPGTLLRDSETIILSAPNQINEAYAPQLCASRPDMDEYIKYGERRDEAPIESGRGIKRSLDLEEIKDCLLGQFQPVIISKIQERTPPSIFRYHNNNFWECAESQIQRHPAVQPFHFLFKFYRLHKMWTGATRVVAAQASEVVVLDRDFVDSTQPYDLLWCTKTDAAATQVAATQVRLKCNAASDLLRASEIPLRDAVDAKRFGEIDVVEQLGQLDAAGGHKSLDREGGREGGEIIAVLTMYLPSLPPSPPSLLPHRYHHLMEKEGLTPEPWPSCPSTTTCTSTPSP